MKSHLKIPKCIIFLSDKILYDSIHCYKIIFSFLSNSHYLSTKEIYINEVVFESFYRIRYRKKIMSKTSSFSLFNYYDKLRSKFGPTQLNSKTPINFSNL